MTKFRESCFTAFFLALLLVAVAPCRCIAAEPAGRSPDTSQTESHDCCPSPDNSVPDADHDGCCPVLGCIDAAFVLSSEFLVSPDLSLSELSRASVPTVRSVVQTTALLRGSIQARAPDPSSYPASPKELLIRFGRFLI